MQLLSIATRGAVSAALASSLLFGGPPAHAYLELDIADAQVNLASQATRLASAVQPLVRSLRTETFAPLESSLAAVVRASDPVALGKTAELGRAALASVPADQADKLKALLPGPACAQQLPLAALARELKPLPDAACVPSPESLEQLASAAAAANPEKVQAFTEQAQATWAGATKRAGLKVNGELVAARTQLMQGIKLPERRALQAAFQEYASATERVVGLRQAAAEGPPRSWSCGATCKQQYEQGLIVDDSLLRKGWVKQRYPSNFFLI